MVKSFFAPLKRTPGIIQNIDYQAFMTLNMLN